MPVTAESIAGVWKLRAYSRRFLDTGEIRDDMLPHAYIIYTPGGHMMSVTVEEHRQPPASEVLTDEERNAFIEATKPLYEKWVPKIGEELYKQSMADMAK